MAGSITGNGFDLQPSAERVALQTNYITNFDFLNQYLPDTYEKEFERYGNRTISGFLRMVGAEMPTNSDMIKWAEQGRLHTQYTGVTYAAVSSGSQTFTIASGTCVFRVGQTVILSSAAEATNAKTQKGIITAYRS